MSLATRIKTLDTTKPLSLDAWLDRLPVEERAAACEILNNKQIQHVTVAQVFAEEYPDTGAFTPSTIGRWRRVNGGRP
jgi:hypothetical protein